MWVTRSPYIGLKYHTVTHNLSVEELGTCYLKQRGHFSWKNDLLYLPVKRSTQTLALQKITCFEPTSLHMNNLVHLKSMQEYK